MTRQKTNGLHKSEANRCAIIQPKKRTSRTSRSRAIKPVSLVKAEWMRASMVHGILGDFKSKFFLKSGTGNGVLFDKKRACTNANYDALDSAVSSTGAASPELEGKNGI